jgi:peptidyl-prolyl cis-trans isomerase A (cyclophilin A)/peptidyl-prolyl cis-trans isomerase B (cyclophilin B)
MTPYSRRQFVSLLSGLALCSTTLFALAAETPRVSLKTNIGEIVLELNPEKAPKTAANFLSYVKSGHYNGTIFHRVIDGFMIQGGGFDKNMRQKPVKDPVENEAKNGLKNERYTIAMARTNAPHSATAQFFINVNNNDFLDYPGQDGWGYCVFGRVIKGMDVVDRIRQAQTSDKGMYENVPIKPIIIESASMVK